MKKKIVVFAGNDCIREDYFYPIAYETGKLLAAAGFVTVTGGGPGLMNQICKGAFEAKGETIGICLNLKGRKQSDYLTRKEVFDHLIQRQQRLISLGDAFIAVPGGVGTVYEIFEILSLKRKKDIEITKPLILIDGYFHQIRIFLKKMEKEGFLKISIENLIQFVETPNQAIETLIKKLE